MFKKIIQKLTKNGVEKKDEEFVKDLVYEGNAHLSELQKIDQKILSIQKSTKTTFSFFSPVHNYCRGKYTWYYNWHIKPYATKVHFGVLILIIISSLFISSGSLLSRPKLAKAASITSAQSGLWSDTTTWTGGVVPGVNDTAFLNNTVTVPVSTTVTAGSVSFGASSVLTVNGTLNLSGDLLDPNLAGTLNMGDGSILTAGDFAADRITTVGTNTINVNGNYFQDSGMGDPTIFSANTTVVLKGINKTFQSPGNGGGATSNPKKMTVEGSYTLTGSTGGTPYTSPDLTISSGGSFNFAAYNFGMASIVNNGTLQLAGGNTGLPASANYSGSGTVEYTATSGTKTIQNWTYGGLKINGTGGTFIPAADVSITGDLNVAAGIFNTKNTTDKNLTIGGNMIVAGTLTANSSTITVAGNWDSSTGTFTIGTSTVNMTGNGSLTTTANWDGNFYNLTAGASGKTTTVLGSFYVANTLNIGAGSLTAADGLFAGLKKSGDSLSLDTNATVNVSLDFGGSAQNLPAHTYSKNIYLVSYGCTVTQTGAVTINGNLMIDGTSTSGRPETYNSNNYALTVLGNVQVGYNTTTYDSSKTLTLGSSLLKIGGNLYQQGILNANTSTIEFTKATGTQTLTSGGTGAAQLFNNLTHSGAGTLQLLANDINVDGIFTNSAGTFDANNLNMTFAGAWNNTGSATFTRGSGTLTFDGTTTATNSSSNAASLGIVAIPNTVTLGSNLTMASNSGVGTLNLGAGSYTLTLTGTGTPLAVTTFQKGTGSTVVYTGTTTATTVATVPYNNLTFTPTGATAYNMSGSLTGGNAMTGSLTINANATLNTYVGTTSYDISCVNVTVNTSGILYAGTNNTVGTSTFTVAGNWTATGTFTYGLSTVNLTQTGTVSGLSSTDAANFYNLTCAAPSKTTSFNTGQGYYFIYVLGTFTTGTGTLTGTGSIIVKATGTSFSYGGGSISGLSRFTFAGNAPTIPAATYSALGINASSCGNYTATLGGDITAASISVNSGCSGNNYYQTLNANNHNITATSLTLGGTNITSSLTMGSGSLTVNGTITITSQGTSNYHSTLDLGSGTHYFGGNFVNNDTITAGTSTVTFNKSSGTQTLNSGGTAAANQFNNLTHSGAGTLQLATNAINIDGNFINSNGTFDANDLNVNVAKDFNISGGSFSPKVGGGATTQTVTLDSTNPTIVSGSTTFNNLTMDASVDGAKTINFTAGTTQTIPSSKTWTINGASGKVLTLRSTSADSPWYFNIPAAMASGNYLSVQDSYSANSYQITPGSNVTNAGNNNGWIFNVAPNAPTLLGPSSYVDGTWQASNTPTLTFNLSDPDGADQVKYEIIISPNSDFSSPVVDFTSELGAQGARSYTVSPALADGAYFWEVKTIDSSSVASGYSVAGNSSVADIKVDTAAPTTNINIAAPNGNQVSSDPDFNWYKTSSPAFTLSETPDGGSGTSTIYYAWNLANPSDTNLADFTAYTGQTFTPADGKNIFYYIGTDAAGNQTTTYSRTLYVDTVAPTVTEATTGGISNGNGYYIGTAPTITLTENDDTSLPNPSIIKYKLNSGSYQAYAGPITASEGSNIYSYYAIDEAGNNATGTPTNVGSITINLSTNMPQVVPTVTGTQGMGNWFTTLPSITLTGSNATSGVTTQIKYKWDSDSYSALANSPVNITDDKEGYHVLYYSGTDSSGQTFAESHEDFYVDTMVPITTIHIADSNGDNGWYKNSSPTFTLTAADGSGSGVDKSYYYFDSDSPTQYSDAVTVSDRTNSILHYYTVDNAGNTEATQTKTFNVDTVVPTANIDSVSPANPNTDIGFYKGIQPTITLTGSDDRSGFANTNIQYRFGTTGNYQNYSSAITVPEGVNTLYYYAVDNAGNTGAVNNQTFQVDLTAPSVANSTPIATTPTNKLDVVFTWSNATDSASGVASYLVSIGSTSGASDIEDNVATTTNSFTETFKTTGTYFIRVKAIDNVGYISDYSSEGSVLIDQTSPVISINNLVDNTFVTTKSINFSGTASKPIIGIDKVKLQIDNGEWQDATSTDNFDTWTYSWNNYSEGNHTIVAKALDKAGNEKESTKFTVIVDTVAPAIPTDFRIFNISNPTAQVYAVYLDFAGSTDATSGMKTYEVYRNGVKVSDIKINKDASNPSFTGNQNQPYFQIDQDLSSAKYSYKVRAIDLAGNISETPEVSLDTAGKIIEADTISALTGISSTVVTKDKTSAVVSWQTVYPATSFVEYGETTNYGQKSDLDSNLNQGHNVLLKDLKPQTTYHAKVTSKDIYGRTSTSDDISFTTKLVPEDKSVFKVIIETLQNLFRTLTAGAANQQVSTQASQPVSGADLEALQGFSNNLMVTDISFKEKNLYQNILTYPKTGKISRGTDGKNFSAITSSTPGYYLDKDLSAASTYYYRNEDGLPIVRKPVVGDDSPLQISDAQVTKESVLTSKDKVQLTIFWKTNRGAGSHVDFGTSSAYGQKTKDDTSLNMGHNVVLDGLDPDTTYHFKATSRDAKGNITASNDFTFQTPAALKTKTPLDVITESFQRLLGSFKNLFGSN